VVDGDFQQKWVEFPVFPQCPIPTSYEPIFQRVVCLKWVHTRCLRGLIAVWPEYQIPLQSKWSVCTGKLAWSRPAEREKRMSSAGVVIFSGPFLVPSLFFVLIEV